MADEGLGFVSDVLYSGPPCTLCGAVTQYRCLSCGSTPGLAPAAPEEALASSSSPEISKEVIVTPAYIAAKLLELSRLPRLIEDEEVQFELMALAGHLEALPSPASPRTLPTLEKWLTDMFHGANLDRLEIPARTVIQIAESYAAAQFNRPPEVPLFTKEEVEEISARFDKEIAAGEVHELIPVNRPPEGKTCPACGTDLRCVHGRLFAEKCLPCEEDQVARQCPPEGKPEVAGFPIDKTDDWEERQDRKRQAAPEGKDGK